jgi:hypothetical protein
MIKTCNVFRLQAFLTLPPFRWKMSKYFATYRILENSMMNLEEIYSDVIPLYHVKRRLIV